jgi:hypothetical protein
MFINYFQIYVGNDLSLSAVQIPTEMSTSYFSSLLSLGTKYVNAVTLVILLVLRYTVCQESNDTGAIFFFI